MLERKSVLLAKVEATYGNDPTPTVTSDALLVSNLDIQVKGEPRRRDVYRNTLSKFPYVRGMKSVDVTFTTEIKGSGEAGTIPAWGWEGTLFRGCGMVETEDSESPAVGSIQITGLEVADKNFVIANQTFTFKAEPANDNEVDIATTIGQHAINIRNAINDNTDLDGVVTARYEWVNGIMHVFVTADVAGLAGNSIDFTAGTSEHMTVDGLGHLGSYEAGDEGLITYHPISSSMESLTLYVYKDGIFHKITGCVGSFKINLEVDNYGTITWNFSGLYVSPIDATPAACTFSSIIPPAVQSLDLSLDYSYYPVLTKVEIDMKNKIAARKSVNADTGLLEWIISDREPVGSFDPEVQEEAVNPFWGNWENATTRRLWMQLGSDEGNKCIIKLPSIQMDENKYGARDGLLTYQIPFSIAATGTGDGEIYIIYK